MDTTIVAETTNLVIATSWKALLDGAGIDADVMGADLESVWDGLAPSLACYRILVPTEDAGRARELIDDADAAATAAGKESDC